MDDKLRRKRIYKACIEKGLLPSEAKELCYAKVNSYDKSWQSLDNILKNGLLKRVLTSRVRVISNLRHLGWSDKQIKQVIVQLHKSKEVSSTWAFVRSEYAVANKGVPDYKAAIRARALTTSRQISKGFRNITGVSYKAHKPTSYWDKLPVRNTVNQENKLF